jgi:hypothetical protein
MNRTTLKSILVIASLILCAFQTSQHIDLSGKWKLDLKKSVNLPESFKHVDSFTLEIKQTSDSVVTMAHMTGNGQDVRFPLTSYALNGKEVFREDAVRKSKRWSKSSWSSNGKKFIVDGRVEQQAGPTGEKYSQRDTWEFLDKNTLQISVLQKFPDGKEKHSERRILHRVK